MEPGVREDPEECGEVVTARGIRSPMRPAINASPLASDILLGGSMTNSPKSSWVFAAALLIAACSTTPTPAPAPEKSAAVGSITRFDAALDALVPKDAQIEKLAGGFTFTEGPLWR